MKKPSPKVKPFKLLPDPKPTNKRSRYPRWVMKSGAKVRIEDMSDTHLGHTIKMLERNAQVGYPYFAFGMDSIFAPQGEMACAELESLIDSLQYEDNWEVYLPDIYYNLVDEASRRGLDLNKPNANYNNTK